MNILETEVLIIGASASGSCAAIQAARMGRKVILCEESPWIGGMLTASGVSAIDGNDLLPAGLWGEFRAGLRQHYGSSSALSTGWVSNTQFEPVVGEQILRTHINEQRNITLWTLTQLQYFKKDEDPVRVREACFRNASGKQCIVRPIITIFADEYGDCVEELGLPWKSGLEGRAAFDEPVGPESPSSSLQNFTWCATLQLAPRGFADETVAAPTEGEAFYGLLGEKQYRWNEFFDYARLPAGKALLNWPVRGNDYQGDYLDTQNRSRLFAAARHHTLHLVAILQDKFGSDAVRLAEDTYRVRPESDYPSHIPKGLALIPYIREARRIAGVQTLSLTDINHGNSTSLQNYAVAVGDYPLDHHRSDGLLSESDLPSIDAFSVPYGCLIPRDSENLLVVEKSISVSGIVNGCTRLQPVVMQLGQAAGAAAALCVEQHVSPEQLNVRSLQQVILEYDGYLVPTHDMHPGDEEFKDFQKSVVCGEISLRFVRENWCNRGHVNDETNRTKIQQFRRKEEKLWNVLALPK